MIGVEGGRSGVGTKISKYGVSFSTVVRTFNTIIRLTYGVSA